MTSNLKSALLACTALCALSAAGMAQAGTLRGHVSEAGGTPAPAAMITVDGQELSTEADSKGDFVLRDLKPGTYALTVHYVGLPPAHQSVTVGEGDASVRIVVAAPGAVSALTVVSQRAADRRALQVKKSALAITEVLQANDAGKLPDQNVAEAVRRLPSISVANDQGEGRYVIIRGIDPRLANVTVNGQTQPAPEPESRQVKLDDIPTALIQSIQINKVLTADLDANAIAGQVNIDTASAFDRNRPYFGTVRGAYGRYDLNGKNPYEADLSAGGVFGPDKQFGVIIAGNTSRRPIRSENFGSGGPVWSTLPGGQIVPSQEQVRAYNLTRARDGFIGNFDWRPKDGVKLYLRTTYSKFSDHETRDRLQIDAAKGVFAPNGPFTGTFTKAADTIALRLRSEDDNTKVVSAGGVFELPVGHLEVAGAWSRAEKIDPIRSEWVFKTAANISGGYDASTEVFLFTPSADTYDASKYPFASVNFDTRQAVETLQQVRGDYTIPIDFMGDKSSVKVGAKYIDRLKTNNRDYQTYKPGSQAFTVANTSPDTSPLTTYDGRYLFGPRINYDAALAYMTANPKTVALDVAGSVGNSLANDYRVTEKIASAYAMVTLKAGPWTVIPGVRVENTAGDYKAKAFNIATSTADQGYNVNGSHSYTDVFPGLNVRYDFDRSLVARGAVTTSIGRPDYNQLAPFTNLDTGGKSVAVGNPNLQPFKSVNYDLSLEYYLPWQGLLSVGLFYKDIKHPVYTQTRAGLNGEVFAGTTIDSSYSVTQFINANAATLKGVELNAQSQFPFLPSPLDGLGAGASLTLTDGHASGVPGRPDGDGNDVPLAFQSQRVSTIQIFYEKYGLSARVAYSYRSHYLDTLGAYPGFHAGVADPKATDNITADFGQLDAKASYAFNKSASVFFEAANLNNAPWRRWVASKQYIVENERYGSSYKIGVQLNF